MSEYPSMLLVFVAGLLSFFSPCVLPLIPSYLSILGGQNIYPGKNEAAGDDPPAKRSRPVLFITTLCFILGFTAIFIALSIIISTTFLLMGGVSKYIRIASGIIVIILGLNILFDFLAFLNYEKRFRASGRPRGLTGAFLAGAAFGAGWTPCIGPILAGVLFLAGQSGKAGIAALYLALYSLGLGLPFLLAAAFFDRFLVTAKWFRARLPLIKKISGILLIIIGLLILTGHFSALNIALQKWQNRDTSEVEGKTLPDAEARISSEVEKAFHEANIRILKEPVDPPDFTLPFLNGGNATLSAYKGKVVVLNFWATWCPPCRAEMPSMEIFYQRFKNNGVEILAVDGGEDAATVQQFIGNNYTFPVLLDKNNKVNSLYGIEAIPTTFILDREGKIIGMIVGSIRWDNPNVIAAFEQLTRNN